jgi:hypothetical protein
MTGGYCLILRAQSAPKLSSRLSTGWINRGGCHRRANWDYESEPYPVPNSEKVSELISKGIFGSLPEHSKTSMQ